MPGIGEALEGELAGIVARLVRSTVQVHGGRATAGSGVLWNPGLIVTNAHVARTTARVVLFGGRSVTGRVLSWDRECDLAAIAIDADGLPAVEVGDSHDVRVGELVIAVGHALGLPAAVTTGVIHATSARGLIQADLRLAPGNSGGPLADARGRVVGINTMIAGGLACAVPSRVVERFLAAVQGEAMAAP